MIFNEKKYRDAFDTAKSRYTDLEFVDVDLEYGNAWFFTMHTGIKLSSIVSRKRKYLVKVNLKRKDILRRLSHDDLVGWFGHELAHIIDYQTMSLPNLLTFAFKYLFDFKFRFSVERRINAFCYNSGFAMELYGVWKKFLSMPIVNKNYRRYIVEHYCPKWEDIKETSEIQGISKEAYESQVFYSGRHVPLISIEKH